MKLDSHCGSRRAIRPELIARADIMIVNFPPPARERLRLRWEDVEPLNPRLIYCSLTGYGETGPDRDRPGFDVTAYFGRSGILDLARYEGGPPGLSLPAQGDRATAMTLVAAILLGLRQRDRTGKGCWVGTSLYANGVWSNGTSAAGALVGAHLPPRQSPDKPRNALTNLYRTRDDRWLQLLLVRDDRLWPVLCKAIERPDLAEDPRFLQRADRRARSLELVKELMPVFAARTYAEWEQVFAGTGIPFGVIGRLADVVHDEQARHAGIFADTDNADVPRTVNNPIRLGFAQPRKAGPPPAVGQHSEEILRQAGFAAAEIDELKKSGALG
jgi:formyl-CoA transferase